MPQPMRSSLIDAAGCFGCSAWAIAICSREKAYLIRSFAASAGIQGSRGLQPVLADRRQNLRLHVHPPRSIDAMLTDPVWITVTYIKRRPQRGASQRFNTPRMRDRYR